MATATRFSLFFLSLLLLLLAAAALGSGGDNRRRTGGGSARNVNSQVVVDCSEIGSKLLCSKYPNKCRWCRSDSLDDACFSVPEARRLPAQVFSCA